MNFLVTTYFAIKNERAQYPNTPFFWSVYNTTVTFFTTLLEPLNYLMDIVVMSKNIHYFANTVILIPPFINLGLIFNEKKFNFKIWNTYRDKSIKAQEIVSSDKDIKTNLTLNYIIPANHIETKELRVTPVGKTILHNDYLKVKWELLD